jgi:hypothetical protein
MASGHFFSDSANIPTGDWYHLAQVLSGTTGRIYVNGALTASSSLMTPPTNAVRSACWIGSSDATTFFANAAYDEIKFYSRALSPAEVLTDAQTNGPIV